MTLTHLARTGCQSLRIKLEVEAAVLSCYGRQDQAQDRTRSTKRLLPRLKHIISQQEDRFFAKALLHGYMFDAWSMRKCSDEFLTLNAPWPLTTDSFLQLIAGLDLQDDLLSCLLDVSYEELLRLLKLVLSSAELSTELVIRLFLWTTEVINTGLATDMNRNIPQRTNTSQECLNLWLDRIQEQGRCRQLFRTSFRKILNRLLGRITRASLVCLGPWSTNQKTFDVSSSNSPAQVEEEALDMIQEFFKAAVLSLVQGENCSEFVQDVQSSLERWDAFVAGKGTSLSQLLPKTAPRKRRRIEGNNRSYSLGERLILRQRSDSALFSHARMSDSSQKTYTQSPNTADDRHKAFITICNNIRQHLDTPQHSSFARACSISRTTNPIDNLAQHIHWLESTISDRSSGWRSCVKLKLQFYDAFSDTSLNEDFADFICKCNLQWDLCDVLCRNVKRYRVDSVRMPLETLQLGCELLLSVFTKSENLRAMMRDHLFVLSRSIAGGERDPLFGSWDLWRLNIDTLLISTLNQIVATEDPLSSSVSARTVESLVKISLIAPYQVVSKTIQSAITNRGQCTVLLETLASLGQLVWLRSDPTRPTLLATVLRSLICEKDFEDQQQLQQQQRQDNLVDFVLQALDQKSSYGMVLLDQTEFLQECVVPLLDGMVSGDVAGDRFFHSIATILMRLYELPSTISATSSSKPLHEVHFQILGLALQLRSLSKTLISNLCSGRNLKQKDQGWDVCKIGSERMEDISKICELSVLRLASFVNSGSNMDPIGRALLEAPVRSLLEAGDTIDWESKLVLTPLINACRKRLGAAVEFPELPYEIRTLCGDHLSVFNYKKTDFSAPEESDVAKALLLSLSAGRMCDDAIQDITQALCQTSFPRSHSLEAMLAPAIYRILSISSRSECHRLLIQGVPSLMSLCPGSSDVDLFWGNDTLTMPRPLGLYWKRFAQGRERVAEGSLQGAASESSMDLEDVVLVVLNMSETLLRFALEPVPPKHKDSVLQVYGLGVGSNMMADQVASLIQSSVKALQVDWSLVQLDLVLFCFLMLSKMSYSVSVSTGNISNPHQRTLTALDPRAKENKSRQMAVAKSRARDELVLMAMNVSEEIIRRVDAYHHTQAEIASVVGSENAVALGSDCGFQGGAHVVSGKRRGRGLDDIPRTGTLGHKEDKAGNDYPSPTSPSSSALHTSDGTEERTIPLPNSISAPSATEPGSTVDSQVVAGEDASGVTNETIAPSEEAAAESSGTVDMDSSSCTVRIEAAQDEWMLSTAREYSSTVNNDASVPSSTKPVLAPHQIDCLMLGLELLPEQEQHAVKARLRHVLLS